MSKEFLEEMREHCKQRDPFCFDEEDMTKDCPFFEVNGHNQPICCYFDEEDYPNLWTDEDIEILSQDEPERLSCDELEELLIKGIPVYEDGFVDGLIEALKKYGSHTPECVVNYTMSEENPGCICGFQEIEEKYLL